MTAGAGQQQQRGISPSPGPRMSMSVSPQISPPRRASITQRENTGHRSINTFDVSELSTISQDALDQERIQKEKKNRGRLHSVDAYQANARTGSHSPAKLAASDRKGVKEIIGISSQTPPRSKRISMFKKDKKGHNRTKSLEASSMMTKHITEKPKGRASLPTTPRSDGAHKSTMYPDIVSDLMHIKLDTLELPSLAKPSPTSFLTGKEDEVLRTSESEPTPYQMEIPTLPDVLVAARLNEFVDSYRRIDQNFDLQQWVGMSRMDLRHVSIPQHIPIAQSILDCGDDACLRGVVSNGLNADERLEVAVFEGQRQFMAVFRGTTKQQKEGSSKSKKKAVPLDKEHATVEVYNSYLEEYMKVEAECFALLDKLTDLEPFCDIVFTGHSYGAAMATIAAFRYALGRPMVRVSCITLSSPKAGFAVFRNMVNSQPNLKVMRFELGQDGKCQLPGTGGSHVGHTIVMHGALGNKNPQKAGSQAILAYKFETPKPKKFKTSHPDLRTYVTALEEIASSKIKWPTPRDYVGNSGKGVVVNNEARLVV
jgi:hypothetical protein